jgi:phosphoenolpyruvate carboxylase
MNEMTKLAELGQVGGPNKVLDAMKTWFRPLGIDVPETATEEYRKRIANYIANLQQQKAFGTELSKSDYDLLEKILSDPGLFTSPTQLMSQIKPIVDRLTTTQQDLLTRADYFGLGQLSRAPSRASVISNISVGK